MRRFLGPTIIALVLAVGAMGVASVVHAQGTTTITSQTAMDAYDLCISNGGTDESCDPVFNAYINAIDTTVPVATASPEAGNAAPVGSAQPTTKAPSADDGYNEIMIKIMSLFAWLVGVAALTLDYAVYYTVVKMGDFVHNLSAIGVTWRILRDIGNILLIFGFLAAGIMTILSTEIYGWKTSMIPKLLIAAVFLNFSLFISEAIIDTGNLFATQFYTQINGGHLPTVKEGPGGVSLLTNASGETITTENEGISNKIMTQLGLQTIYGKAIDPNTKIFEGGNPWIIGFMGIILFIVTAFVLFTLAFVLIARFVMLVFLLVVAPFGFAGLAIPALSQKANEWWSKLFEQTISAPILFLLLYVALAVITDAQFLTGFGNGAAGPDWLGYVGVRNLTGFAGTVLSFLVAMGLLLLVVIQSKNLGAAGAGWATKTAGALSFGATAWGLRSTVGWGSQRLSHSLTKGRLARVGRVPIVGRALVGAAERGGKGSFDVRGTKAWDNLPGGGIDAGKATEGGFRKWEETKIKEREEYAKKLGQTGKEKANTDSLGTEKARLEKEHKGALATLDATHSAERQPLDESIKAQRARVSELRAKAAQTNAESDKKDLERAEASLNNDLQEMAELRTKQAQVRKDIEAANKEAVGGIDASISALKRAPQEGYVKGLRLGLNKDGFVNRVINPQRNTKVADNIIKEATKGKVDKDLDSLKKLLEESAKK